MSNQRGRQAQNPVTVQAKRDLRKFAGKKQRTDFSFLIKMFPKKFGNKVFRIVTDDQSGSNMWDYMDRGWIAVTIGREEVKENPALERFFIDKEKGEGGTIRIPVNKTHPELGAFGILMMKDRDAFLEEERAALNEEVRKTELSLTKGQDQAESGAGNDVFYAPKVDAQGTRGFKVEQKGSLT